MMNRNPQPPARGAPLVSASHAYALIWCGTLALGLCGCAPDAKPTDASHDHAGQVSASHADAGQVSASQATPTEESSMTTSGKNSATLTNGDLKNLLPEKIGPWNLVTAYSRMNTVHGGSDTASATAHYRLDDHVIVVTLSDSAPDPATDADDLAQLAGTHTIPAGIMTVEKIDGFWATEMAHKTPYDQKVIESFSYNFRMADTGYPLSEGLAFSVQVSLPNGIFVLIKGPADTDMPMLTAIAHGLDIAQLAALKRSQPTGARSTDAQAKDSQAKDTQATATEAPSAKKDGGIVSRYHVVACAYDDTTHVLSIRLASGVYQYADVPSELAKRFAASTDTDGVYLSEIHETFAETYVPVGSPAYKAITL